MSFPRQAGIYFIIILWIPAFAEITAVIQFRRYLQKFQVDSRLRAYAGMTGRDFSKYSIGSGGNLYFLLFAGKRDIFL